MNLLIAFMFLLGRSYTQHFEQTIEFKEGGKFELKNENGEVKVKGWNKEKVKIEAKKFARAGKLLKDIGIDIKPDFNKVEVITNHPKPRWFNGGVSYKIWLPKRTGVKISNTNGGVEVVAVEGKIDATTTNGDIEIKDCEGKSSAKTTNGDINAEFLMTVKEEKFEFKTINGNIELRISNHKDIGIYAKTANGEIQSDFPVYSRESLLKENVVIKAITSNGDIYIRKWRASI